VPVHASVTVLLSVQSRATGASQPRCAVTEELFGAGLAGVGTVPVKEAAATAGAGQTLISRGKQRPRLLPEAPFLLTCCAYIFLHRPGLRTNVRKF
jgi:hypothetical protein